MTLYVPRLNLEREQGMEFNLEKEIEFAVGQLIQNYELVKDKEEVRETSSKK